MCRMLSHRNDPQQRAEGEARIERRLVLWVAVCPRRSSTSKKQPTLDCTRHSVLAHARRPITAGAAFQSNHIAAIDCEANVPGSYRFW
jgi:hypothetical protein